MMNTFAIVPVKKFENSKARLSSMFGGEDRIRLASLMLNDTLTVLTKAKLQQIVIVSSDRRAEELAAKFQAKFLNEHRESGVNSAVILGDNYCNEQGAGATIVIPQDLPLLNAMDVARACEMAENEARCIVICPSLRYDGTNFLLRKPPTVMETYYDSDSYHTHIKIADQRGIPVKLFFSQKLMFDVDTPEDVRSLARKTGSNATMEFIRFKLGNA